MSEASGGDQHRRWVSRRAFLSSGAAAGVATVALGGLGIGHAAAEAPTDGVDAMVLQVAAAAAVFPFRVRDEAGGPALVRLTADRVSQAWKRCSSDRAQQAKQGAQLLLDRKLGGVEADVLLGELSRLAAKGSRDELAGLTALVAVAGATLADQVDPDDDLLAGIWLGTLAKMHANGDVPVVGVTA